MNEKDEIINNGENEAVEEIKDGAEQSLASSEKGEEVINDVADDTVANSEVQTEEVKEEVKEDNKKEKKSKKEKKPKTKKLKNVNAARKGLVMIITVVVLAAVLILVNVGSVIIAQKLPTTVDVTADNSNSLTDDNIKFIKSINENVEIIICATREGYTGSEMVQYAANTYYVQENTTPYNYYNQTITLIEMYPKYNSKIKVNFVDTQKPDFNLLEQESGIDISYGDIIVRCKKQGSETYNTMVVSFDDIYELYDASNGYASMGYGYYTITSSNIESKLSSAIYTVASSEKRNIAFLAGHSDTDAAKTLTSTLTEYNYDITEVPGRVDSDILSKVDTVLLVAPVSDLTGEELKAMDKFLDNDGKRGKNFLVFGSLSSPATPNLDQFMEEWGIKVEDGIAYETESSKRVDDATIMLELSKDDLVKNISASEKYYYSSSNKALSQVFETKDSRTTHILMTTSDTATIAPKEAVNGYTAPKDAELKKIPVVMVCEDTTYDDKLDEISSYVGYFGSEDIISSFWTNYNDIGNLDFAVTTVNATGGRANSMYFLPKITGTNALTLTESQKKTVRVITFWVIPPLILIGGVWIWIRRRNR